MILFLSLVYLDLSWFGSLKSLSNLILTLLCIQLKISFLYIPTAANICNLCTLFHDILLQKLNILLHSSLIRLLKNAFDLNFQCQHLNSLREFFWLVTVAQISYYSTYCSRLNPNISCFSIKMLVRSFISFSQID